VLVILWGLWWASVVVLVLDEDLSFFTLTEASLACSIINYCVLVNALSLSSALLAASALCSLSLYSRVALSRPWLVDELLFLATLSSDLEVLALIALVSFCLNP
jgi:hypothetical protein